MKPAGAAGTAGGGLNGGLPGLCPANRSKPRERRAGIPAPLVLQVSLNPATARARDQPARGQSRSAKAAIRVIIPN
jgi:hypothetical protein